MKLYNYWRSSSSWRVRIGLAYKKIPYEYVPVHLVRNGGEQYQPAHKARNPMSQVPVLEIMQGGKPRYLTQSLAILEYLEETVPSPPLLPKDPFLRAEARRQAEVVNSGTQPFQGLIVGKRIEALGGDKNEWLHYWVGEGLKALETFTSTSSGKYSIGDQVTIADCYLIPQLYSARRFNIDLNPFSTLLKVEKACNELPAFQESHPSRQPDAENT